MWGTKRAGGRGFDLAVRNTVGDPFFAHFAKSGNHEPPRNGFQASRDKSRVGSIATRPCKKRVRSHDILYTLSPDILYTLATRRSAQASISLMSETPWGAPFFADFAKSGNHERVHNGHQAGRDKVESSPLPPAHAKNARACPERRRRDAAAQHRRCTPPVGSALVWAIIHFTRPCGKRMIALSETCPRKNSGTVWLGPRESTAKDG